MRLRIISISLVFCIITVASSAQENDGSRQRTILISDDTFDRINRDGEVVTVFSEKTGPTLMPAIPSRERLVREVLSTHPSIGVELLSFVSSPRKESDRTRANALRRISSASGLTCYFPDKKSNDVFFKEAYAVSSAGNPTRIPDPIVAGVIPGREDTFALFDDAILGRFVCSIEFGFEDGAHYMSMYNTDDIWMFIIPITAKHNARNVFVVFPYRGELVFYGLNCVNTTNLFGISDGLADDFHYRIRAILNWYENNLADTTEEN
jgi:hypothetical protein